MRYAADGPVAQAVPYRVLGYLGGDGCPAECPPDGLTDPALTSRWWRHHATGGKTFISDWKNAAQVILDSDPYRRLAFTWQPRPARHFRRLAGRLDKPEDHA
jgi:hypothetical protein